MGVEGEVDGWADPRVIEGGEVDVEGDEPEGGGRAEVDEVEEAAAEFAEAVGGGCVEHPIGLAVDDGGDGGFVLEAEFVFDAVGPPRGLGVGVPGAEIGVALDREAVVGVVGGEAVRAGAGEGGGAGVVRGGIGREDAGVGEGEFGKELGVGAGEADGDLVAFSGDAVERAGRWGGEAGGGAGDGAVEGVGGGGADAEDAVEAGDDIGGGQGAAVGEADAGAEVEAVEKAAILGGGERVGEVGDEVGAGGAGGFAEGDQAIIGEAVELPVLGGVVDLRVQRAAGGVRQEAQRVGLGGGRRGEQDRQEERADHRSRT